ncbi:hypothetical protein [Microbacterium rhizomatis]|uniref:Uncharacterized protein n=1 Tax=Microbacterium rhizomatis TaxID=1631477 RepID=A0A5J5J0U2_9MICO|nr:hypothetical protein [Microbacterium rhizomatis]KAA9108085.1 hypothetical protein F6B43_11775 [Microbacterium rhizomatis]
MSESNAASPDDLTGTVDEWIAQLAELEAQGVTLPAEWLRRQLGAALTAWADAESRIDIDKEAREDY